MNRKEITSINNRTYELMYNNYYDITTVTEIVNGNNHIKQLELKYIGYCYGNIEDNETINFIKDMIINYENKNNISDLDKYISLKKDIDKMLEEIYNTNGYDRIEEYYLTIGTRGKNYNININANLFENVENFIDNMLKIENE